MKADRLLRMLLLLQTHQHMSTADLARKLEVSQRTILRDVQSLSSVGVPVYTEQGRHGGIRLLDTYRANISALNPNEIHSLLLTGLSENELDELGIGTPRKMAEAKIRTRHPTPELPIIGDTSPWFSANGNHNLGELLSDIISEKLLTLWYRTSGEVTARKRTVAPHGLGFKGGRWYLIAEANGIPRLYALDRLEYFAAEDRPAVRQDTRPLKEVWKALITHFEEQQTYLVTALLRSDREDLARRILGSRLKSVRSVNPTTLEIAVAYPRVEGVRQLLQFGNHIQVTNPFEARTLMKSLAEDIITNHN